MEALLVKIFATALALSQVMTTSSAIKTEFDRRSDQPRVAKILNAGCAHMLKAFEVEDINIDDLIATAMDDPQAIEGAKVLRASILPTCRGATSSSVRTRRSIAPRSISVPLSTSTTRPLQTYQITASSGITGFPVQAPSWIARAGPLPRFSRR